MIKKGRGKIPNKGNMRMKDQKKQASSDLCLSQDLSCKESFS